MSGVEILVDMDGVLCDWDARFFESWNRRSTINREKSFYIEQCLEDESFLEEAKGKNY